MLRQADAILKDKASEQEVETSQFAALAHKLKTQEQAKADSPGLFSKLKSKLSRKKKPAVVQTIEEKPAEKIDATPVPQNMDDTSQVHYSSFSERYATKDTSCWSECCASLFSKKNTGYQPIRTNSTATALLAVPYDEASPKNRSCC